MTSKVVVVGLDACDAQVADELMARGRMPHLAGLHKQGACRALQPPTGLFVGAIWPSIATGCGPGVHGIYSWRQFVPGEYATRKMRPEEAGAAPFWSTLSNAGAKVAVIDAPLSAPDLPGEGLQIVDWGSHDRWMQTTGVRCNDVLADRQPHPVSVRCDHSARTLDDQRLLDTFLEGAKAKGQLSLDVLESDDWDLFVTVFAESHCAGHHFWKHHDPLHVDHDPEAAAAFGGNPLHQVYDELDRQLGLLLGALDTDTTVVVLLSHGFVPHYGGEHVLNEALLRIEQAIAPTPTWRSIAGKSHRVGHWAGKKVRQRFRGADPSVASLDGSRAFFQVPNNERFGGVRLNRTGREPRGFVDPESPVGEELVTSLERELLELRCPETGRALIREVVRVDDHHGGHRRSHLPDLLVDWDWSAPIDGATSATIGTVHGRYEGNRSGDHRGAGRVVVNGPGAGPGDEDGAPVLTEDLAPTIAAMLDQQLEGVDGRVINGFLNR